MEDTPGSPTTPITPFHSQYGQQHQELQLQLQLQQQRSRLNSPPPSNLSQNRTPGAPEQSSATAPGADTSIASISSTHSFSSLNEGAARIVSNSILANAVEQSMAANSGDGSNSANSSFIKQSSISRGISNNLPGAAGGGSQGQNASPISSGAIQRPPMSTHRTRDHNASTTTNTSATLHEDASFSSVTSAEGATSSGVHPGSIIANEAAEAVAQEGAAMAHAAKASPVSTAIINTQPAAAAVSGTETGTGTGAVGAGAGAVAGSGVSSAASALPAQRNHQLVPVSSNRSLRQQGQSSGGHGHARGHHSKRYKNKGDGARDTPRPSTVVPPAPTPAMHWTCAKVHGQIPPKNLRAQTANLVGESIYVFGGCDAKGCYNNLYIFDADTMHWSQPKTFGSIPPPCRAHTATLVDNKRLFVFGGGDGPQYFNDLYILDIDTLTWSNPPTTGMRPCKRRAHTTCVYNNRVYVFGGGDGVRALNDTFQLDLATMHWSEVKTTGQLPMSRGYHTGNLIKSQLIVYGGSDGHECFSDVHVLDLDTKEWTKIDINVALPRLSHTSTQVGSYLFVIGGHDGSRYSCDVAMLNLVTWSWETRKIYGIPPAGRGYHASLLYDSRLFMFGGYDGQIVFDDIYILDLSTCAYLPQITDFQIILRRADFEDGEEFDDS